MFLIEGHTDAVGTEEDNLSLSDRRAEAVAVALTEQFQIPPENLTTQGYGEQQLKVPVQGPEEQNRRVTVRRITPLLAGKQPAARRGYFFGFLLRWPSVRSRSALSRMKPAASFWS